MSKIKMAIERCMDGPTKTDSVLTSSFMFPPEFVGFQGHFPTNKVLPGVCQIQCALSMIEKALEKRVVLKEIVLAKYLSPVVPGDTVICTVSGAPDAGTGFIYKARITNGTKRVSDLKLRVCPGDAI